MVQCLAWQPKKRPLGYQEALNIETYWQPGYPALTFYGLQFFAQADELSLREFMPLENKLKNECRARGFPSYGRP